MVSGARKEKGACACGHHGRGLDSCRGLSTIFLILAAARSFDIKKEKVEGVSLVSAPGSVEVPCRGGSPMEGNRHAVPPAPSLRRRPSLHGWPLAPWLRRLLLSPESRRLPESTINLHQLLSPRQCHFLSCAKFWTWMYKGR